jgi:menaquinone-9 beta-reductase
MFDFTVVGSGPSGSYCAAKLAKLGYQVKLIDKAPWGRDKLCGGGLTLKSIGMINKLHSGLDSSGLVDYVKDFEIGNPITKETIKFNYRQNWLGLVKRNEFDDWMRNKAIESGVVFEQTTNLPGQLHDRIETRFIIAADGVNSAIGKTIHGPFPNDEVVIATEAYIPTNREAFASVILNPTHDSENGGYSWLFGRSDRIGVGTGVVRSYDKHMNFYRQLISKLSEEMYSYKVDPSLYRNWVIPIFKYGRKAVSLNAACIGDALGVADPIYAEGIAAGIYSADCLVQSFQVAQNFQLYEKYLYNHEYFRQMKWMQFLQKQANSNVNLAFRLLQQPGVVDGFVKFINWQQTPYQFVKWIWKHYPMYAMKLEYNVIKNKGSEKEVLKYAI